jgi:hypothetical protein
MKYKKIGGVVLSIINFIKSVFSPFKTIIKKPTILIPQIGIGCAYLGFTFFTLFMLYGLIDDIELYYSQLGNALNIISIASNYWIEIAIVLGFGLLCGIFGCLCGIATVRMARGEKFGEALSYAFKNWKKGVTVTIVFILGIISILGGITLVEFILNFNAFLGIVFSIITFLLFLFLGIKIAFFLPAYAYNDFKPAFKKAWEFSNKKFLSIIFYIICVFIIQGIIQFIGQGLSEMFIAPVGFDIVGTPFLILIGSISSAYFLIALTNRANNFEEK